MHQILGLRDYTASDGKTKKAEKFYEKHWRCEDLADLYKRPDHYLAGVPAEERENLYYTISECKEEPGRKFVRQRDLPFDVDNIDTAREEQTAKVVCAALGLDWYKTAVIASGNGLQLIVRTMSPFEDANYFEARRDDYKACCEKINDALRKEELPGKADSSVWSPARLMRMPNTWNKKPNKETRLARVLQENLEPIMFDFKKAAGIPVVEPEDMIKSYPPPDTKTVLAECEQIKWMKDHPEEINEPEWYAALSVLSRLGDSVVEGREISHLYSKGHPGYSESETDMKIDQALKASGPRTCGSFSRLNSRCLKCAWNGKVKSPILIKGPDYIGTRSTHFHHMKMGANGAPAVGNPDYHGLLKWFKKHYKYVVAEDNQEIYTFNGQHWEKMAAHSVQVFAARWFGHLSMKSKSQEFYHAVITHPEANVSRDWFTKTTHNKLAFRNGVFDLRTKELTPHSPDYGFLSCLDYDYDPHASCPRFDKFMSEITGGYEGYQKTLLEFAGYCFSNDSYWEHKALFMYGVGNNGKSTYLQLLKDMGGTAAAAVEMKNITHEYWTSMLYGKFFNISDEGESKGMANVSTFKTLSAGGSVGAREPYGKPFTFENRCKLMFAANYLPATSDVSMGYFRRLLLVPFTANFTGEIVDKRLSEKLNAERSGIFNRFLSAYEDMKQRGECFVSDASLDELERYKTDSDSIRQWVEDCVEFDQDAVTRASAAYNSYVAYCENSRLKEKSNRTFGQQLPNVFRGVERIRDMHGNAYKGFKITQQF